MLTQGDLVRLDGVLIGGTLPRVRVRRAVLEVNGDQVKVLDYRWRAVWLPASMCTKEGLPNAGYAEPIPGGHDGWGSFDGANRGRDAQSAEPVASPSPPPWLAHRFETSGHAEKVQQRDEAASNAFGTGQIWRAAGITSMVRSGRLLHAARWLARGGIFVVLCWLAVFRIIGIFLGWWEL